MLKNLFFRKDDDEKGKFSSISPYLGGISFFFNMFDDHIHDGHSGCDDEI